MEPVCHRCGAVIDPAKPFCAQCGAPQIRVAVPEPHTGMAPLPLPSLSPAPRIAWASVLPKAAGAALVVGLLTEFLPLIQFIAIPLAAATVVWLYSRGRQFQTLPAGAGMRIGLVTGFMCFLVSMARFAVTLTTRRDEFYQQLREQLQQAVARDPNPQAQQIAEKLLSPEGLALLVVLFAVISLILFLLLGLLGGVMAAGSLRRRTGAAN